MKKQQFYKIVRKLNVQNRIKYTSVFTENPFCVRYYVHRYVQAPIGGLLVFNDYDAASELLRDFMGCTNCPSSFELWKVLVKDPIELPTFRGDTGPITSAAVVDAWGECRYGQWLWPLNTQAFKFVRLEKRLFYHESR